jgi:formylglycine-generating enzyme required for sulfatase activity
MNILWKTVIILPALSEMAHAAFVTIGDTGNPAMNQYGRGSVSYEYRICDHEVTIAEYIASGAGDGDENYWNDGTRTVGWGAPAVNVSFYEAMRYCNWLTSGDIDNGAYIFVGGVYQLTDRGAAIATYGTIYAIPTENEWVKAAYYTGNSEDPWSLYANGTDTVPASGIGGWNYYDGSISNWLGSTWATGSGAQEQNGTYDMMGNVKEWIETPFGYIRGGSYLSPELYLRSSSGTSDFPDTEFNDRGFRVVMIPEPSTILLFGLGGIGAWLLRRNQKRNDECDE